MSDPPVTLLEMSTLKLALLAAKVRRQSESVLNADPIAVVGMACRVPGASSLEEFWEVLREGRDATGEVPADRWDAEAWFDADPSAPGKASTKRGGFLDRVDLFDADFFGILPREAERMDPQQRMLLEVAIEALDAAGFSDTRLAGSRTGVFIASYHSDYARLLYRDPEWIDARTLTGAVHSVVPNRLSYLLDLRGPSISVDTACSSSLVATHLACQSLRSGESDLALAGGVSLMIAPEMMVAQSKVGFMAPDGRCKTFDARADGFARGEGCGVVVLKRLSDALADGDPVLAVVRGSAVNQDGHSTLLAAPNGLAQEDMIREAVANAQIDPARIGYVEAHGTGTQLGDPLEVEALAATIGKPRPGAGTCYMGAAKANVGHLEAAAGVVGLIKAVLVLGHEVIPPQANFHTLSPYISLDGTRLAVPTELVPWPRGGTPRLAATSGFGIGGTNAHVILEEAPELPSAGSGGSADEGVADVERILPISARGPEALGALVERWVDFLDATEAGVVDLSFTASQRRTHHDHRLAVVGRTVDEWREGLREYVREGGSAGVAEGHPRPGGSRVGFVFSGQGPQWYAMGRELLAEEPVFRGAMEACDAHFRKLAGWSILEELALSEEASRLDETEVAQPALFAVQVSLAALWKSWGVTPDGVVGHSVGEISALYVAGALGLEDAVRVVWQRSRIMQEATGLGRMASVGLTEVEAAELVAPFAERLGIAAVNAPRSVVLSGEAEALETVLASLTERGVFHRMLPVNYAFHSVQMAPFQRRLVTELAGLRSAPPTTPVYSTVSGGLATGDAFDADYFGRNIRQPVRFASAIGAMLEDGFDTFLEVAPHPVLSGSIAECVTDRDVDGVVAASLRRGRAERSTMLQACATLYCRGAAPDWEAIQRAPGEVTALPPYPWQHVRYWMRTPPGGRLSGTGSAVGHPMLQRRVHVAGSDTVIFEGSAADALSWLTDHRVFGRILVPAAAVIEAFVAAATLALDGRERTLAGFAMHRPLVVGGLVPGVVSGVAVDQGMGTLRWQIVVAPDGAGGAQVALYEATGTEGEDVRWVKVASAEVEPEAADGPSAPWEADLPEAVAPDEVYRCLARQGVELGPDFQVVVDARRGDGVAEATIELPPSLAVEAAKHVLHPVLLDGALLTCALAAGPGHGGEPLGALRLPLGADRVRLGGIATTRLRARARVRKGATGPSLTADVTLETPEGVRIAVVEGMRFAPADRAAMEERLDTEQLLYEVAWERLAEQAEETAPNAAADARGDWLIFADRGGAGEELAEALGAAGGACTLVFTGANFARGGERRWTAAPADPEQIARVLAEGEWSETKPLRGVVHLWDLDIEPLDARGGADEDVLGVGSLLHLAQRMPGGALRGASSALWIVTRGAWVVTGKEPTDALRPRGAGAWGLADVIAIERPELRVRRIDVDPADTDDGRAALARELTRNDDRSGVALRGAGRWTRRLVRRAAPETGQAANEPRRLTLVQPGTLDGVELRTTPPSPAPGSGEVRLRVLAAGVNFRDVLFTLGMYPGGDVPLGAECCGIVLETGAGVAEFAPGDRVFGYAPGAFGTEVVVPAAFLAPAPPELDDVSAAAIPVAFLTAYYGLHRLADMRSGERVLIHAAAGGVGLAAVRLAQRAGAEVFATAGSPEKREMLRSIGVPHVMDSRSLDFADEIRRITQGEGVDIVLNSLAGDFIPTSFGLVARGGRFLELGKRDVLSPEAAAEARPDVRYHLFDLGAEGEADHALLRPMLDEILAALSDGTLHPLPTRAFALERAGDAFRFMAQAKHVGKLVLVAPRAPGGALVSAGKTYWVTGGLGALGIETARWLVRLGARTLVLTGRSVPGAAAAEAVREIEAGGVTVRVVAADAGDAREMSRVLADVAATLPPLGGVVHAAGMLEDAVLVRQSLEACRRVLHGKAHGAWVLHELTRDLDLDFFILYSAAGVLLGAPGQGAYPAANAELDALAQARALRGLPALSVAWGAWADAGMAANLAASGNDGWAARGLGKLTRTSGFAALERLMRGGAVHAAAMAIDWDRFMARLPEGMDFAFFRGLAPGRGVRPAPEGGRKGSDLVARLRVLPESQRRDALLAHLRERALNVLGQPVSTSMDAAVPLREMGLDSLMAVELRNALSRSVGKPLPATLLFDHPTLDALAAYFVRTLSLLADASSAPPATTRREAASIDADDLAGISEEEAAALLLSELERAPKGRSS